MVLTDLARCMAFDEGVVAFGTFHSLSEEEESALR